MPTSKKFLKSLQTDWTIYQMRLTYPTTPLSDCPLISSSTAVSNLLLSVLDKDILSLQEQFVALYFKGGNRFIGWRLIGIGSERSTIVDRNLIVGLALISRASGVIVAHTHPSGIPYASNQDRQCNEEIKNALKLIKVHLIDHFVITANGRYISFSTEGLM